jgi:hypothetical protein
MIIGMKWKVTCYDRFIIYFNRGNNWFVDVPKCSVILSRIKYIDIEQEINCFNMQIPEAVNKLALSAHFGNSWQSYWLI